MTIYARKNIGVLDDDGNVVDNITIEVRIEVAGQPLAALKANRDGSTPLANPYVATDGADAGFYALTGTYQIRAYLGPSGAPTFERIWRYEDVGKDVRNYGGTSATSLLIASGVTKVFATQEGLAYQVGNYVRASSAADGNNYMEGLVSAYADGSLSIDVTKIGGSGTYDDWVFQTAGAPGVGGSSGSTRVLRHTNLLPHSSFIRGGEGWAFRMHTSENSFFGVDGTASNALFNWSARSMVQMDATVAGKVNYIGPAQACLVDTSKRYKFGVWANAYGVSLPLTGFFKVHCLNINLGLISTLSVAISVSSTISVTTSLYTATIEAEGGGAPAFPAGTVAIVLHVGFDATAAHGMFISHIFAVREDEYPGNFATAVQNSGGGTHEAVSDGTHMYVISHGLNELVKFDANMTKVAVIALDDYPHDIVIVGTDLWVTNYDAQSLQRISLASFTVTNTYAISSAKNGFGLATDGTNLWLGAGTSVQGCALYSVNTTTGAQTLLSTDLFTGGANLPLQFLDGSLWAVHETNATVQRINPSGGATIATIATGLGGYIYGLGSGDGYVFACGQRGVAQIDPATNTVVNTYLFRELLHGGSNVAVVNGRAYAGGHIGVAVIDYAAGTHEEIITEAGVVKWCRALPDDTIAVGYFASPIIHILSSA
ncbi:MAG: hypothetical protein ABIL01_16840 [Pseudomonadota bacterium]